MNEDARQLITKSFLSDKEKNVLLEILKTEGESESFFQKFSDLLIEELKRRGEQYHVAKGKLDTAFSEIEGEISKERKGLDDWLKKQLTEMEPTDFESSGKIFDEYYEKISEVYKKQDEQMKNIFSKILISTI